MGLTEDIRKSGEQLQEEASKADRKAFNSNIRIITMAILLVVVVLTYVGYTEYDAYTKDRRLESEGVVLKSARVWQGSCTYAPSRFLGFPYDNSWDVAYTFALDGESYRGSGKCRSGCSGETIDIKYIPADPRISKPQDSPKMSSFIGSGRFYFIIFLSLCLSAFGWIVKKVLGVIFARPSS